MKTKGFIRFLLSELLLCLCIGVFSYYFYESITKYKSIIVTIPHMSGEMKANYFVTFGIYAILIILCSICVVALIKIYRREKYI